ncbi:hypothetical protein F53441_1693 [Fusarium austroafricanum]|uniref:F-box domain-containing protein n=1 Tax=Fusarium austroafricanum TaxID=2364996 RepID=A0A8H4P3P3_9HYPO|nr:hypothetical protein F53441_1693 [Fusarium austroafricanum]
MASFRALDYFRQQFDCEVSRIDDDISTTDSTSGDDTKDIKNEIVSRKTGHDASKLATANVDNYLVRLPAELQVMILQHLTFGEVESLRRTCRLLRYIISKPFVREVFPTIKFELLSTCYRCLRYDPGRDHLIHADESDARYPLANECLDCVSSRGGFVVGRMYTLGTFATVCVCRYCGFPVTSDAAWKERGIVLEVLQGGKTSYCAYNRQLSHGVLGVFLEHGLWVPPLTGIVRLMERRSEGVRPSDIATVFFVGSNM